jgi:pheromone shutdown protein TraB
MLRHLLCLLLLISLQNLVKGNHNRWKIASTFSKGLRVRGGLQEEILLHSETNNTDHSKEKEHSKSLNLNDESWRIHLPHQLQQRRGALHRFLLPTGHKRIVNNLVEEIFCEVYILGTAHVSKDSCEDVKLLMDHVKPDVLFVELCNQRIAILDDSVEQNEEMNANATIADSGKDVSVSKLCKDVMEHNPGMSKAAALSSALLTKIQGDYASKLGVTIGGEFKAAFRLANEQQKQFNDMIRMLEETPYGIEYETMLEQVRKTNGCVTVLGDRPVRLTLVRAWEALSFFGKIKLIFGLIWSSFKQPNVEELKEWIESIINDPTNDILTKSIEELSIHFPAIKKTIIEERDVYMGCKILQTAEIMGRGALQDGMTRKIVCIVGAGHCPGISSKLRNITETGVMLSARIEQEIKEVIETRSHQVDKDPNMKSLISEVTSMESVELQVAK